MNQKRIDLEVVVFENKLTKKKKNLVLPFIVDKDYLHSMGEKVPAKPNVEAVLSLRLQCSPPGPAHLPASVHSSTAPGNLSPPRRLELTALGTPGTPACRVWTHR